MNRTSTSSSPDRRALAAGVPAPRGVVRWAPARRFVAPAALIALQSGVVGPAPFAAPAGRALAHGESVTSVPAPGAVVSPAPTEVSITVSAPLGAGSAIEVLDPAFRRVDSGPTEIDPATPQRMRVAVTPLAPGDYTVQWTAIDLVDGHTTRGGFVFEVGTGRGALVAGDATRLALLAVALILAGLGALGLARRT